MFTDARLRAAFTAMVRGIDVPAAPLLQIQRKIEVPKPPRRLRASGFRLAIATAAIIAVIVIAFPSRSMAVLQSVEARYRAALEALGGSAPPPAPGAFVRELSPRAGTLATAQALVHFKIVPPVGLPRDVVSAKIQTAPTGVYSKATQSWRIGAPSVTFLYRRANGRSMILMAEQFDPNVQPPKYMFEPKDDVTKPSEPPVLIKHRHFVWRNGDQAMSATEGDGMSAAEIETIRATMHGVAVRQRDLHAPGTDGAMKLYRIPKP